MNSISLSMTRVLIFAENRFITSAFFSKLHLPFAKSFEECFLPDYHCWSYQKWPSSLRYFCRQYCFYQYSNGL